MEAGIGYLDGLVISYITQSTGYLLQDVPDKEKPAAFLAKLSREQQSRYIEDTLSVVLSEPLPEGYAYVMLPNDCFKYKKTGANVIHDNIPSSNGKGPIYYAFEEIEREINSGKKVVVLFYNQQAKKELEQKIRENRPRLFVSTEELVAPGYGIVTLHTYSAAKPLKCPTGKK